MRIMAQRVGVAARLCRNEKNRQCFAISGKAEELSNRHDELILKNQTAVRVGLVELRRIQKGKKKQRRNGKK